MRIAALLAASDARRRRGQVCWAAQNPREYDRICRTHRAYARTHAGALCIDGLWFWLQPYSIQSKAGNENPWHYGAWIEGKNDDEAKTTMLTATLIEIWICGSAFSESKTSTKVISQLHMLFAMCMQSAKFVSLYNDG